MDFLARAVTFVRVVEAGSLSAAARSLRMSLAAVSRQVTSLEAELDAKLFLRTARNVRLTDEGRRFLEHASRLVREAEVARASVRKAGKLAGTVVLSASVTLGVYRIVPFLPALLEAHPLLAVELRLEDRAVDLAADGVDIAVRAGMALPDTSHLIGRSLATFERCAVASPSYLRRRAGPKNPSALGSHDVIAGLGAMATWAFEGETVTLTPRVRVGASAGIHAAARAGMGIAVLPEFVVAEDLAAGTLNRVLAGSRLVPATAHALTRSELRGARRIDAVIEHLKATVPTA